MAITTDYHTHTELSVDAHTTLVDNIRSAIDRGLTELAVTDHVDFNPNDEGAFLFDPVAAERATRAAAERFADRIAIRHGIELSEPHLYPDDIRPLYDAPMDVVIGSIHYVGPLGFHAELFDRIGRDDALGHYFDDMLAMARFSDIDVLGHLDYFERYARLKGLPPWDPSDFRQAVIPVLEAIIDREIALEVNASGLRTAPHVPFPHPDVLKWYRDLGGTLISLGSDAHRPEQVGQGLDHCAELLVAIGFREYHVFRGRAVHPLPLRA